MPGVARWLTHRVIHATRARMLTENQVKEHLALAYIYAVAARARCAWDTPRVDMDSVDVRLSYRNDDDPDALVRSPELGLQVKAHVATEPAGEFISFFLKRKNHHDLVRRTVTPRLLVVMLLPENPLDWLSATAEQLVMKRCAYWANLYGDAPTENAAGVTVRLPTSQVFDPDALQRLMRQAAMQELQA
jgi:Domain of unknown function (DUF4365)